MRLWASLVVVIIFLTGSCSYKQPEQLTVFAGAGLKDVLPEIAEAYTQKHSDLKITFNFAGSGTLQKQIEQGAQADLLIIPGEKQLTMLAKQNLIDNSTKKEVASDVIVLIIPKSQKEIKGFPDLLRLEFARISIGNPETVPAGEWAKKVLLSYGIWERLKPRLILAKDVQQVLAYVETGNVDAGLVYHSTALKSNKVNIIAIAPPNIVQPASFKATVLENSKNKNLALDFLRFLSSRQGVEAFKKHGFLLIRKP